VELELAGDLDLASAARLRAAMSWLRRRYPRTIVVDTRRLDFVDLAGYRALRSSLAGSDGQPDPRTVYVVGEVVARLQHHLALATAVGAHPSTHNGSGRSIPTS
jgi:anti-anti-sigma regulatory factor